MKISMINTKYIKENNGMPIKSIIKVTMKNVPNGKSK
jgi:hypothetical protein